MGSNIKGQIYILDSVSKIHSSKNISVRKKIGQISRPEERPHSNQVIFSVGLYGPESRVLNLVKDIIPENGLSALFQ